ncbi:hypothetical protein MMC20_007697 [Loxospora ochrophaea]|nr:hypothetical protein [Loxospora ochrophaea]
MRNKPSSSMQKTYDECYLICSTAVYFEGQNNEVEALRSWRSALDQIYYHNAYRVPANYRPKSETEKALQESLRDLEIQCKERVDLLEALRQSRLEGKASGDKHISPTTMREKSSAPGVQKEPGWIGEGTIPAVNYPDLSKRPPLPQRPPLPAKNSFETQPRRPSSMSQMTILETSPSYSPPVLPVPVAAEQKSRSPSPSRRNRMLTTLRPDKDGKRPSKSPRSSAARKHEPPAASKAAGLAWDSISKSSGNRIGQSLAASQGSSTATVNSLTRNPFGDDTALARRNLQVSGGNVESTMRASNAAPPRSSIDSASAHDDLRPGSSGVGQLANGEKNGNSGGNSQFEGLEDLIDLSPATPPFHKFEMRETRVLPTRTKSPVRSNPLPDLSYRKEYPPAPSTTRFQNQAARKGTSGSGGNPSASPEPTRRQSPQRKGPSTPTLIGTSRRPLANTSSPRFDGPASTRVGLRGSSDSAEETTSSRETGKQPRSKPRKKKVDRPQTPSSTDRDSPESPQCLTEWDQRVQYIQAHLPKGVDEHAAKQIFNEIVVKGDEVHWDDVAGLDAAKTALKEAVVYPFLRPDLFMGLREPARGMLLFGPPGTGKTMLARAVATESRSTFFAISASSLTSKWLGESEKLVRALFSLAKALAPSIIFVDEIDSLLSSRGGSSEHESTRRIKTEFLIQWSDLQRAAAGKEQSDKEKKEGDASRVLVLAATNLPWAIDEAARRRFVRRQYIPLPEGHVRGTQLKTLLGHQKHSLSDQDIQVLVELTDGFSGSDITALAKDAAMGPLRSLGEALLSMSMEEIRPIRFEDFEASLVNIRPSVSKEGLKAFENWAKEFGERGG